MYSTYALNENVIKKEERRLLRDIVPFVQTALIRLYIEDGDAGRSKIHDFFNQFSSNGQHQPSHLYLLETEIQRFAQEPRMKDQEVTKEAIALL